MKICRYCNKEYPETDFGIAKTTAIKVYRRCKCRYCYRKTKNDLKKRRRGWLDEQKTKLGCKRCGNADYRVLDFHHRENTKKEFAISEYFYHQFNEERLNIEVSKCEVLCANCHRIVHAEEKNNKQR